MTSKQTTFFPFPGQQYKLNTTTVIYYYSNSRSPFKKNIKIDDCKTCLHYKNTKYHCMFQISQHPLKEIQINVLIVLRFCLWIKGDE